MAVMKAAHLAGWMAGQLVERLVEGTEWKMVEYLVDSKG